MSTCTSEGGREGKRERERKSRLDGSKPNSCQRLSSVNVLSRVCQSAFSSHHRANAGVVREASKREGKAGTPRASVPLKQNAVSATATAGSLAAV